MLTLRSTVLIAILACSAAAAEAQDMTQYLDLNSEEFTRADMTRADIEAAIAKLETGAVVDLSGKRLNKLDLSGMDLRRVKLQSSRLNGANLKGADLTVSFSIRRGH